MGCIKVLVNVSEVKDACSYVYDVCRTLPKKIKKKPKDSDGTEFTIGDCLDDIKQFLTNLEISASSNEDEDEEDDCTWTDEDGEWTWSDEEEDEDEEKMVRVNMSDAQSVINDIYDIVNILDLKNILTRRIKNKPNDSDARMCTIGDCLEPIKAFLEKLDWQIEEYDEEESA